MLNVIRETTIRTAMRYEFTSTRTALIKNKNKATSAGKEVERPEANSVLMRMATVQLLQAGTTTASTQQFYTQGEPTRTAHRRSYLFQDRAATSFWRKTLC